MSILAALAIVALWLLASFPIAVLIGRSALLETHEIPASPEAGGDVVLQEAA